MKDLTTLNLKHVYDSSEYHLVHDLMSPLLSHSTEYCRGVGYFTSGWIKMAAEGLSELISTGGTVKLIMSPILDKNDWEAISLGQLAKDSPVIKNSLFKSIDEIKVSLEEDTLNSFAWMIADNLIEIRFAIPRQGYKGGDYHNKVGYFIDSKDNCVAIHGSFNDSIKGTLNGEAFSVFRSWDEGQKPFVCEHVTRLNELWNDNNTQFHSFQIPQVIKNKLIQLRTTQTRPYRLNKKSNHRNIMPKIPDGIKLFDYQNEAIAEWQKNNRVGIFEMATGSGKTYTALAAAVKEIPIRDKLLIVILVPYVHLLEQWKEDCIKFGLNPILCGSSNSNWKRQLRSEVSSFRFGKKFSCILAVHKTASTPSFLNAFTKISDENKLLIADEVHGLGARNLSTALQENFSLRLGLSATPQRWYDEIGTKLIFDYFDKSCFTFSLSDAISKGFLVKYKYYPILVEVSDDENEKISQLSTTIGGLYSKKSKSSISELEKKRLEKALRARAMIIKRAENKKNALNQLLDKLKQNGGDLKYSLFYSPEGQHKDILLQLKENNIFAHQFVGEDSISSRKEILEQFESGNINALVAMKCLDEGVNVPATQNAFFLASTTNPKEFIQRRGRVLRKSPKTGKKIAYIYDFIVIPQKQTPFSVAKYILERELPRFAEFSDEALNCHYSRDKIRPILDHFEMLDLLDKKPWDVYHEREAINDYY